MRNRGPRLNATSKGDYILGSGHVRASVRLIAALSPSLLRLFNKTLGPLVGQLLLHNLHNAVEIPLACIGVPNAVKSPPFIVQLKKLADRPHNPLIARSHEIRTNDRPTLDAVPRKIKATAIEEPSGFFLDAPIRDGYAPESLLHRDSLSLRVLAVAQLGP